MLSNGTLLMQRALAKQICKDFFSILAKMCTERTAEKKKYVLVVAAGS